MRTFLEICQDVMYEIGLQGNLVSVETAVGYEKRLVDAVMNSWKDLQSYREDWKFLRREESYTVVAGDQTHTVTDILGASNRFGRWDVRNFIYIDSNGKPNSIFPVSYDWWIQNDMTTSVSTPRRFTIRPWDNAVLVENYNANKDLTLTYYRSPHILALDDDVPECPQMFENVLFWNGVKAAARIFNNTEKWATANIEYERALGALMRDQIPSRTIRVRPLV